MTFFLPNWQFTEKLVRILATSEIESLLPLEKIFHLQCKQVDIFAIECLYYIQILSQMPHFENNLIVL